MRMALQNLSLLKEELERIEEAEHEMVSTMGHGKASEEILSGAKKSVRHFIFDVLSAPTTLSTSI